MSINVRYFASLKENIGREVDTLPYSGSHTAESVWQALNPNQPLPANVLIAVNHHYAGRDSAIADGDELAFFPPVTGG